MRKALLALALVLTLSGCAALAGFDISLENKTAAAASGELRLLRNGTEERVATYPFEVGEYATKTVAQPKERGAFVLDVALDNGRSARLDVSLSNGLRGLHVIVANDTILASPVVS